MIITIVMMSAVDCYCKYTCDYSNIIAKQNLRYTNVPHKRLILTMFTAGVPSQAGTVSQITAAENDNWRSAVL